MKKVQNFYRAWTLILAIAATGFLLVAAPAFAHAVAEGDKGYIQEITGIQLVPFAYLGARFGPAGVLIGPAIGAVIFGSLALTALSVVFL